MVEATKPIVAVIDDDLRILESLGGLLKAAGHPVRVFPSAAAFFEDENIGSVGCLISDVGMPDTDGFEVLRKVKAWRPDLPVILISGRIEIDRLQGAEAGSRRFFMKPFDSRELLATVQLALEECKSWR
ncbi:response regulator transcription factor [Variovorax sp. GT1P44]|uniref:response regulator transcription factor n=1 Tax=Variovorax sp. GT1P44 TaxID=3443742 RepID=UPI003F44940F